MSGQSGGHRPRLSKLNDQLTCKLCGGYFVDATTIVECLHSFCRSCIVKYLESNKYCPICEVQVHKSRPLLNIRPDRTLQDIVYKLVPGCYQNEMRCRREFYSKHPEACTRSMSPEERGEPTESHIYSPDESLSLSLEYFSPFGKEPNGTNNAAVVKEVTPTKPLLRRYLRCPAAVTVFHLQKLIRAKYGLSDAHRVDVMYKEEPLCASYTLMDVMYIYHWRRKVPLHLSYRIFESSPKRIRLSEDNASYRRSLLRAGIEPIDSKDEKSLKREWKEVQLKISESGVMSITDISNSQFKKTGRIEPLPEETTIETVNTSDVAHENDSLPTSKPGEKTIVADNNETNVRANSAIDSSREDDQSQPVRTNVGTVTNATSTTTTTTATTTTTSVTIGISTVTSTIACTSTPTSSTSSSAASATATTTPSAISTTTTEDGKVIASSLRQGSQEVREHAENNNVEVKTVLQIQKSAEDATVKSTTDCQVLEGPKTKTTSDGKAAADEQVEKECTEESSEQRKRQSKTNNNTICKQNAKSAPGTETQKLAGAKIDALSAKLQFQPKITQMNNAKKTTAKEKKAVVQAGKRCENPKNNFEAGTKFPGSKTVVPPQSTKAEETTTSVSVTVSESTASTYVTSTLTNSDPPPDKTTQVSRNRSTSNTKVQKPCEQQKMNSQEQQQQQSILEATVQRSNVPSGRQKLHYPENENPGLLSVTGSQTAVGFSYNVQELAGGGMQVTSKCTTMPRGSMQTGPKFSGASLGNIENIMSVCGQVSESPRFLGSPSTSVQQSQQTSQQTCVTTRIGYANQTTNGTNSIAKQTTTSKSGFDHGTSSTTGVYSSPVPPCPDAIPISLMKPTIRKNELITKGTNLNEICAKIGASGSKINDICAKIGENSKEKNRSESMRNKSEIPDLLKIARKTSSPGNCEMKQQQQPPANIPKVPVYSPQSSSALTNESKSVYASNVKSTGMGTMTGHAQQKGPSSTTKKQSQPVGYKTLRDPPRCWNPTLSKNNYVAVKNQSKESQQSQLQGSPSAERSKPIQSKPAKIFKMRNVPRYLGNPASGVKPMYGIGNDGKEKDQSNTSVQQHQQGKNPSGLSMMKIDPKTLSPIVSTVNSAIVSPPPYAPSARNYQNAFSREICRSTGSPISPKNSPVNVLSTNPFIPSPTPNTNPRLIYPHFPPPFPDGSRFANPLIRSPIGIPPPSAFHSSLPPSINKLYQRSTYMPQTTSCFSPVSQPPTVQRIPPSTYSSPKSPKNTSLTAISPTSFGLTKQQESQIAATSSLENVALLLSENVVPRDELNAFNLSKTRESAVGLSLPSTKGMAEVQGTKSVTQTRQSTSVATVVSKTKHSVGQSQETQSVTTERNGQLESGGLKEREKEEKCNSNEKERSSKTEKTNTEKDKDKDKEKDEEKKKDKEKDVVRNNETHEEKSRVNGDVVEHRASAKETDGSSSKSEERSSKSNEETERSVEGQHREEQKKNEEIAKNTGEQTTKKNEPET